MAQLKSTVISGNLRVTDNLYTNTAQLSILRAPTISGGTTFGPGSSGQFLKSDSNGVYWADLGTVPITSGGTGATSTTAAWTALGGGESGKHADSYFVKAISSTDNAIARFDGSNGQVQNSAVTIDDNNNVTITGQSLRITNTSGARYIVMGNQNSDGVDCPFILEAANGALSLGNGTSWSSVTGGTLTRIMYIKKDGNVGIGTMNASYKLVVDGDVAATNFRGNLIGNADTATTATNLASAPSLAISGTTQITVSAGGKTSSAFTVPYATSAASATTATTADKLTGFSSRASTMAWGDQTGSVITCFASSGGGGWGFRDNNPASGQMSMTIDGTIYIKEGTVNIANAVKSFSVSGQTVTYTNLWGNTGTFTTQDTKNTTGSSSSTNKLYIVGAQNQQTNDVTYSSAYLHSTEGALSAKSYAINAGTNSTKITLQWNDTSKTLDFIFA